MSQDDGVAVPQVAADVVSASHRLAGLGLSHGSSGNVSARSGDRMVITPSGRALGDLTVETLSVVSLDGDHLGGPAPSKELPLHRAIYSTRPDIRALVHLHAVHSTAVACLDPWAGASAIPPITPYFVMKVGEVPLLPFAPPGTAELAEAVKGISTATRALLLANHGPVTMASDLVSAVDIAIELEQAAHLYLLTRSLEPRVLTESDVQWIRTVVAEVSL